MAAADSMPLMRYGSNGKKFLRHRFTASYNSSSDIIGEQVPRGWEGYGMGAAYCALFFTFSRSRRRSEMINSGSAK